MAISGGVKFFKKSKCLFADGTEISATSGEAGAPLALDRNPITYWRSVDSNDTVTETIIIDLVEEMTINRIILADHNWKSFTVKYYTGGAYTHFSSVTGIDGAKANVTETVFADDTAYYEVASVSTASIEITVTTTQTANQQKYINQIILTEEIGTLSGYPKISSATHDRNLRKREMLSGKALIIKSEQSFKTQLKFDSYPASLSSDIDLMFYLHDIEDNFIIWLCGGRRGSSYFKKQLPGFRLKDAYTVQVVDVITVNYDSNIYKNPINMTVKFEEAVD